MDKTVLKNYSFDNDFPKLKEDTKELIGLSSWSMYKLENDEFMIVTSGGCECCHGGRPKKYFITDSQGEYLRVETKEFYNEWIKKIKEIVKFTIPERLTKYYIKFKL